MSRDSWATPLPVYLALDAEFDFKADLCASHSNAKHPYYLTEADDALSDMTPSRLQVSIPAGGYVWCNPPYSAIGPWVEQAITLQRVGIGTVMLVMADTSVGWYYQALQHCNEIREVVAGRLAFINALTGEPVSGNSKGSTILVFDPYGRQGNPRRSYVTRAELLQQGQRLIDDPDHLIAVHGRPVPWDFDAQSTEQHPLSPESVPLSTEQQPLSTELTEQDEPTDFTPADLYHLWINGELHADSFNHFIAALVVMFGRLPTYSVRQLRAALVAETADGDNHVTISGLDQHQCRQIGAFGRALGHYDVTQAESMADAVAELVARNAMKDTSIIEVITQFKKQQEVTA
ncbi:phage N-6-adenine-methyltransferase [Oceanimonas smirnovii]|uniref:phage N-6-adenine-methyltransferase n=1 Tax=Oceanimonas smirnovii TaxID=264574 RepID=UPI0003773F54|nr:phage N-6-adenine-methyltransferase [Oceanimonas smirnovii]